VSAREGGTETFTSTVTNTHVPLSQAYLQIGRDNDGVERVRPKVCRPEPWNDLQLPDGHKRLVQSLIKSHVSDGKHRLHFDLVRSKGGCRRRWGGGGGVE
jgi:hypothetical protein